MAQYFARMGYVTANINYRLLANSNCTGVNPSANCIAAARAGAPSVQAPGGGPSSGGASQRDNRRRTVRRATVACSHRAATVGGGA